MKYVHYYETDSEFQEKYNGNEYEEPWLSLTEQNEEVNYNKIMPIGYMEVEILTSDFGLSFDYNNNNVFNVGDFDYWKTEVNPKPDFLTPDKFNVSDIDEYLSTEIGGGTYTGNEIWTGSEGWDMPAQIVRLANDNGQERWCIFNIGAYFGEGEGPIQLTHYAVYSKRPELKDIAGYLLAG